MVSIQFGVLEAAKRALVQRKLAAGDKPDLSLFESECRCYQQLQPYAHFTVQLLCVVA